MSDARKERSVPDEVQARIERARDPSVPKIYANGFINSLGPGDIMTVLERNGEPVAVLNFSYTVAKTLAKALGDVIARLEDVAGREMLTTKELEVIFKEEFKEE